MGEKYIRFNLPTTIRIIVDSPLGSEEEPAIVVGEKFDLSYLPIPEKTLNRCKFSPDTNVRWSGEILTMGLYKVEIRFIERVEKAQD